MGWTTPATWNPGQVVSATDLNTHLRDNLNFLLSGRARQVIKRDNNANYTTTSTSFVDVDATNLSITLNLSGSAVLVTFTAVADNTGGGVPVIDIDVDGTRYGSAGADGLILAGGNKSPVTLSVLITGLSAGNHTFKPKWKTTAGTAQLYSGNGTAGTDYIISFNAVEIG